MLESISEHMYFGNRVADYLTSLAVLIIGMLAVRIIKGVIVRRLKEQAKRTATKIDDFLIELVESKVLPMLYFGVFYISVQNLLLSPGLEKGITVLGVALLTVLGIRLAVSVVYYGFERYWAGKDEDAVRMQNLGRLLPILKVVIWGIGITFLLDNLGFRISAVVAGLGIGGIAVALAAQAILGDLFSYFSILFDKPFELGDFVIVEGHMGTIEHIGIKTTRIRSLGGEQLVFSNTDLTGSRLKNYKRMEQRRIVFKLGVTYQTPIEKLKEIPPIIKKIMADMPGAHFDRTHFSGFGDFSLDIEIVYYVLTGDYNKYMDIQQDINLQIAEEFQRQGIEFAYPTQTLFLQKE